MFWDKAHRLMKLMTEVGLFVLVWVIAGAVVFGVGTMAWDFFKPKHDEVKIEAKISDKKEGKSEITLKIDNVENYGNLWVARIQEPSDSYRVGYHASNTITRNLIFTADKNSKSHILFDTYKNKITEFRSLSEINDSDTNNPKVFVCSYIKNYNDALDDGAAKESVLLINKSADKQKTIIEDADRVLKIEMPDKSTLNAVYFKEGKLISAIYSLDDFKTISSPAIFDLKETNLKNSGLLIEATK